MVCAKLHKCSSFQGILRAGVPFLHSLHGSLAHGGGWGGGGGDSQSRTEGDGVGANTSPVGWGDAQQAQVGGSAVGQVGAGATKLSGQERNDPPGAGVPTSRPSKTRRKAGRKGEVPTIGCDSCPSPGSATTGSATLDLTTRVRTAGCQVPSQRDAAVGAQRRGLGSQRPRGVRSPPPAAAPRGLVVFAAAEGPQGSCVPRHWTRNVLTFRGDGRELKPQA
ncbi:LOW QUALITY PROTEIN: uncharacterized protein LOC117032815 [Rhinolophus ferrumequinum]|uniref:LOW QUALITY PROTEIN: uncharacterized protein LOC117032815 n=1 Tax=Rhinolophus ferrumequinum TaxID=59479 RepID=UPI00140FEE7F|nr:LOW QUALITY PROTEIN: uncharacterized protein LOC117032815 [Rhinolophus ferrumequinum]